MHNEWLAETTPERLSAHSDQRLEELYRELATIPDVPGSSLVSILRNRTELVRQEIAARQAQREQGRQEAESERRHREQVDVAHRHSTRAEWIAAGALAVAVASAIATGFQGYYARPHEARVQVNAAEAAEFDSVNKSVNELFGRVMGLELAKDRHKTAVLDPSNTNSFAFVDSPIGTFLVVLQDVSAYADGVRVRLYVGNLTTAAINRVGFKVRWGPRMPKVGDQAMVTWEKSLLEKNIFLTDELRPGSWNNVSLDLAGLPPEKLGYVELEMETTHIRATLSPAPNDPR